MTNMNENCCIVRTKRELMAIFGGKGGMISRRVYSGGEWRHAEEIADDVSGRISVNLSDKGELFMFYQDRNGNIILQHFDGSCWKKQLVQENLTSTVYNLRLHAIIKGEAIHLLYNIPSKITGETRYKIVSQQMSGGKWLPNVQAAENVADATPLFSVQNIAEDHYAVYYQTGSMENVYGYKELFLPGKWSSFTTLHQTLHSLEDRSVVTSRDGIHLAFIVKGAYSCQLIYKNKLGPEVSPPAVIFEANRIDGVTLSLINKNVHIVFSAGGYGFFSTISNDGGRTFERPTRLRTAGLNRLIKAEYISLVQGNPEATIYDLFTEVENPGTSPFHEELFRDYYPVEALQAKIPETRIDKSASISDSNVFKESRPTEAAEITEPSKTIINKEKNDILNLRELLADKSEKLIILENKLENTYREISDKNRQIMELNMQLSKKNEETANVTESYRDTIKLLRAELAEKNHVIGNLNTQIAETAAAKTIITTNEVQIPATEADDSVTDENSGVTGDN